MKRYTPDVGLLLRSERRNDPETSNDNRQQERFHFHLLEKRLKHRATEQQKNFQ
jgi:hypothetical protein